MIANIKKFFKENEADIILVIGVILISLISFGGGWLLGNSSNFVATEQIKIEEVPLEELQASPTKIKEEIKGIEDQSVTSNEQQEEKELETGQEPKSTNNESEQKFVASKNSDVYHYLWCPGAQRIKEENKIYFNSKEEVEKAGYRPAKNCPGL